MTSSPEVRGDSPHCNWMGAFLFADEQATQFGREGDLMEGFIRCKIYFSIRCQIYFSLKTGRHYAPRLLLGDPPQRFLHYLANQVL